jgi:diguanylate cyclase (GGDEF)-like protein
MKLRTKIIFLLVPLIVIPILFLGWIGYNQLRASGIKHRIQEMQSATNRVVVYMQNEVRTAASNVELFAKHTLVRQYLLTNDKDKRNALLKPALLRQFKSYQEAFPDYYEIRVFMDDGFEEVRQTRPKIDNKSDSEADNPVFQGMVRSEKDVYITVFRNPDNNQVSLFVGKPLVLRDTTSATRSDNPKLRGYLGLTISLRALARQIETSTVGENGRLFVTDVYGKTLFGKDSLFWGGARDEKSTADILSISSDGEPTKLLVSGRPLLISKRWLSPGLYLYAVLPDAELQALGHKIAFVVATVAMIAILITTASLFAALEFLVLAPIHQLRKFSREIGNGQWGATSGVKSRDEIGELAHAFEDMAGNLKHSDKKVRFLAYHDHLTGLPNRAKFKEYLGHAISRAKSKNQLFALLFLDIDNFKHINDTLGHQHGDVLLREVADRLSKSLRQDDYIAVANDPDRTPSKLARQGGDEFIILLAGIKNPNDPSVVARRIIKCLSEPINLRGHVCHTSASIGITVYPMDGVRPEELVKNADIAMYHAKGEGKNRFQFFKNSMNAAALERLGLETKLRKAIDNDELSLVYQPQVSAKNGRINGVEALLRWKDPEEGNIPPNVFIPVAEQTGLIIPIGAWVLDQSCRQIAAWRKAGYPPVQLAVNVSGIQIAQESIVDTIRSSLTRHRLDPGYLEIEITETTLMSNPVNAVEVLDQIKELGVKIALDDFGVGNSSLNYLRRFPIDTLKIDRSFIIDVDKNHEDEEIVYAITALAGALRLRVVVEGVEREEQLRVVTERGCDDIQGYYFSPPVPPDQIAELLTKRHRMIA